MKTLIIGMLAETFIHPGSGRNNGVIDLPVMREAATDYPFVAGQSYKGALKDHARQMNDPSINIDILFGTDKKGGDFRSGDVRLLLLPVRSLNGAYKWLTCPHLLERYERDCRRSGKPVTMTIPKPSAKKVYCAGSGNIHLEERHFCIAGVVPDDIVTALSKLITFESTRNRLPAQIAIISDDDFTWFTRFALAVQARNVLIEKTKQSDNLWYEESLPPDTLMYSIISENLQGKIEDIKKTIALRPYVQVGGNETVGQGWFAVKMLDHPEATHD